METICRFWTNPGYDPQGAVSNQLISRTLGKIAFVHNAYSGKQPADGEFWFCDIVAETASGQPKGCFLVEPHDRVAYEDLVPITALACTVNIVYDSIITIDPVELYTPEAKRIPWILPIKRRQQLMKPEIVAVIVNLGSSFWERR